MRVLLVDHDSEALETITRAIRGVLELDCVTSKGDALLLLRQNTYDVLIACERAIDGSGLDLLGRTTRTAVPLKRIFAAAPERLQLLGPRLAPFKVQRTINYPIDLEELWLAIAQVTSGPNDETDGTIERVVLDERGIPSAGTSPRAPIPPRPPAPLSVVPVAAPAPAIASAAGGGRAATARLAQAAPEPPLRAPPPPRSAPPAPAVRAPAPPPPTQMRASAPAMQPIPPMPIAPPLAPRDLPFWTPEPAGEDDFAQVAAQARLGVQQKAIDETARRKRQRLLTACGITLVVAAAIVMLIEKFYDPVARAREQAIAVEVSRMAEQQKVTDNLTLIEIDIENAIMNNDLATARNELATLIEKSPDHPRREFLQASIDRAAELAKLSPQTMEKVAGSQAASAPAQAAVLSAAAERSAAPRPRPAERPVERTSARVTARAPERSTSQASRDVAPTSPRTYGAPISEPPRTPSIALNAPINAPPTMAAHRNDNNFSGRTVEASDQAVGRAPFVSQPAASQSAGSAVAIPSVAPAQPSAVPAAVDVIPAKLVKRVTPMAPLGIPRKTKGYVLVRFNISENGRVTDLEVLESQPQGVFDSAAQDAVRKWIYEPRKENGAPVASTAKARLVFDEAN